MPNNMQPHLFVFIALYSEAEIVGWHAFVNVALINDTTGRRNSQKAPRSYHQSLWFYVRWLTETSDIPSAGYFLSNPFAFFPLQLYLNQILNQTSPYFHINFKVQTAKIRQQKVTSEAEIHDSESYAFMIH